MICFVAVIFHALAYALIDVPALTTSNVVSITTTIFIGEILIFVLTRIFMELLIHIHSQQQWHAYNNQFSSGADYETQRLIRRALIKEQWHAENSAPDSTKTQKQATTVGKGVGSVAGCCGKLPGQSSCETKSKIPQDQSKKLSCAMCPICLENFGEQFFPGIQPFLQEKDLINNFFSRLFLFPPFVVAGDQIGKTRLCQHKFHWNCVQQWLQKNDTCPCCREDVLERDSFFSTDNIVELQQIAETEPEHFCL